MCPLQVLIQWQSHDGRFSSHQVGLKELIPEETFIRIQKIHPSLLRQCHEVPPLSLKQLEPETFIQVQKIHPSLLRQCHVVPPLSLKQYLKPSYRYRYRGSTPFCSDSAMWFPPLSLKQLEPEIFIQVVRYIGSTSSSDCAMWFPPLSL